MRPALLSLVGLASLVLAACSLGSAGQAPTVYLVEPAPPSGRTVSALSQDIARMGSVRVGGGFSGPSLIYRRDDVTFVPDPYNVFVTDPAAMLGSRMASWLDAAGPFRAVLQPGAGQVTRYAIEASITELYGDFRPGQAPAAVMTIQFALADTMSVKTATLFERTFTRRVALKEATPASLVRGWSAALAEILEALVQDLGSPRQ